VISIQVVVSAIPMTRSSDDRGPDAAQAQAGRGTSYSRFPRRRVSWRAHRRKARVARGLRMRRRGMANGEGIIVSSHGTDAIEDGAPSMPAWMFCRDPDNS
jgi:hypothetical protein